MRDMAHSEVLDLLHTPSVGSIFRAEVGVSIGMFLCSLCVVFVLVYRLQPPSVVPASAALTEFSAERAMEHLTALSNKPHPVGSEEHARVGEYIASQLTILGLTPELQKTNSMTNIVARLKGTGGGKAVLLVAHYDTVPSSPGASDNSSSVAMLLEVLRALKAGSPLSRDVVFLFSDGEEIGLLGAKAFAYAHQWAKEIAVVLNFDARGNSGASIMFETGPENGWLIRQFASASPRPVATSLSHEIYKLLPNTTDFAIFKEAGFAGLEFAFINGLNHYHTANDTVAEVDRRSLQHQGSNGLALTSRLANENLENVRAGDAIYFDLFSSAVVAYPTRLALLFTAVIVLLFLAVITLGLKKGHLMIGGVAAGSVAILLSMFGALAVVKLVHWLIGSRTGANQGGFEMIVFAATATAVAAFLFVLVLRRIKTQDLMVGGLCFWLVLMCVTVLVMPGASYLFTWPLLFNLVALASMFVRRSDKPRAVSHLAVLALCALPGIILFVPVIYLTSIALSLDSFGSLAILTAIPVLLLGPFCPHLMVLSPNVHRRTLIQ
jgi:hypothetical protein